MGSDALRDAIARRVTARTATGAARDNIIVTPGGQAALFASLMAVLDPGQSCIVLDPFYATFAQTVRAAAGRPILVETPADQGFQPDAAAIERALRLPVPECLGPRILRTETAGMAALAALQTLWGDFA